MGSSNYNLYLETTNGLLCIPCGKIEDIDKFTVRFENRLVFLSVLIEMLELKISVNDIYRVYLSNRDSKWIKEHGFDYEKCLPIKYGIDNFNSESIIGHFADYLKNDRSRLENYKREASLIIPNYEIGNYSDRDIDFFAKKYLTNNYRRQRDEYFYLKELYNPAVMKNAMPTERHKKHNLDDMSLKTREKYLSIIELSYFSREKYFEKLEKFSEKEFTYLAN